MIKKCKTCLFEKDISLFRSGHNDCKYCENEKNKERQKKTNYYIKNEKRILEYQNEYAYKFPDKLKQRRKTYYQKINKEF